MVEITSRSTHSIESLGKECRLVFLFSAVALNLFLGLVSLQYALGCFSVTKYVVCVFSIIFISPFYGG